MENLEETLKKYPFPFRLTIGYRIREKKVDVMWEVENTGEKEMHFQIGAHPAFYYPDFDAETQERGFFGFNKKSGLKYILISEKGCADPDTQYPLKLTNDLLPLDTHTFDKDALILEGSQVRRVTLYNKEKDFAMEFYAEGGNIHFVGYSLFETDSHGNYKTNILLSDARIEEVLLRNIPSPVLQDTCLILEKKLSDLSH